MPKQMDRRYFLKVLAATCSACLSGDILTAKEASAGVVVDQRRCTGCGTCAEVCPVEAIEIKGGKPVVDNDSCIDCGACIDECPVEAIREKP